MSTLSLNDIKSKSTTQTTRLQNSSGVDNGWLCRAWVKFYSNGTTTIYGSGNVSSITYVTTGCYKINFTKALSTANYVSVANGMGNGYTGSACGTGGDVGDTGAVQSTTQGMCTSRTYDNNYNNPGYVFWAAFHK